jgi:hypothetical protein
MQVSGGHLLAASSMAAIHSIFFPSGRKLLTNLDTRTLAQAISIVSKQYKKSGTASTVPDFVLLYDKGFG